MIIFLIYMILTVITWYTVFSLIRIVRLSDSLILIVPIFSIYFWSLFGVWGMVEMHIRGEHHYFEDDLFYVYNDLYYLTSVILYSLFLFLFIYKIKGFIEKNKNQKEDKGNIKRIINYIIRLKNSKIYFLIICSFFIVFIYFAKQDISNAIISGKSAYEISRFDSSAGILRTIFQFSGDSFAFLSLPLFVPTGRPSYRVYLVALLFFVVVILNFILGNRGVLLTTVGAYLLLYTEIKGLKKSLTLRNIIILMSLVLIAQLVSFLRGMTVESLVAGEGEATLMGLLESLTGSSEKYASHISMYGVLKYDVPLTYGSSLLFLLSSLIPTFLGFERPTDSYVYYINQVGAGDLEQGFTINHITGWYINFGIIGVIIGALVWSSILLWFYKKRSGFLSLYAAIIFSVLSIQMIRAGIESYKGVLIMSILIPILIMKFSLVKFTWRNA